MKKKPSLLKRFLIDILLTGACLCVFALFHHVLPVKGQTAPLAVIALETAAPTAAPTATPAPTAIAQKTSNRGKNRNNQKGSGAVLSGEKGGSALSDVETTAEPTADQPLGDLWTDVLGDQSASVSLSQETVTLSGETVTYYIADIYLNDITCFGTALAQDTYGTGYRESIPGMALRSGALVAVNGDYYGNTQEGVMIRNGVVYRANRTDCDVCVLYQNGVMRTMSGSAFDLEQAVSDSAWQAWTFGPALLDADGNAIASFSSTNRLIGANPRTAIGYYAPGHYCFVVVDGRDEGYSSGMTLPQLSQLFEDLGCTAAYNLDGGNSSVMVQGGEIVNQPSGGGRESSDCLYIKEAE